MKAITYLKQIEMMDAQIESDLLEITRLETLATKTTATLGNERVQSSGSQEKMADCVAMIVDMRNKLNEDIDKFLSLKMEARELIANACEPDCCKLLHKRYFHYWTWEKIAFEMGYTYQWVSDGRKGLHGKALWQLQKALDEKYTKGVEE